jgi:hypothetical protein
MKHPSRGQQLMLSLPERGRPRRWPRTFQQILDRLVDNHNAQNRPNAVLSVTREQEQTIRRLVAYPTDPLTYRGHPVKIAPAEPEKL